MSPTGSMAPYSPIMIGLTVFLRGNSAGTLADPSRIDWGTSPVLRAQAMNSS